MGAVSNGGSRPKTKQDWRLWRKISIAIDSGAAEIVVPHALMTNYAISPTDKSRAGVCYASATCEPIPNLGEQKLPLATVEGSFRAMTFQVAPLAKPLGFVQRICAAGHMVVFDSEGSYIVNKEAGELNWLRHDNRNFSWTCGSRRRLRLTRTLWAKVRRLFRGSHSPYEVAR